MCLYSPYVLTSMKFHHNNERKIICKNNRLTIFANAKEALENASKQGMGSEKDRKMEQESEIMLMKAGTINVSSKYGLESEQQAGQPHQQM